PQLIAHCCLAAALTAYEQWLADSRADLPDLLDQALRALGGAWTDA
ncbi:MAG: mycofactocin system transcriptional regulator, partial [Frankiales bacterium]|nr:mycofactocin system transcriptional regulator [Frankiales bacterium]